MLQDPGARPPLPRLLLLAAALALAAAAAAALRPAPTAGDGEVTAAAGPLKVLLIGLDGADWSLLRPWLEAGDLPNLARLKDSGAWGDLRTLRPLISPLIWTSLATGMTPDVHGVTDFFAGRDDEGRLLPVTRHSLRCPMVWDTLSARGRRVAVIGWWATWPADPRLDGVVVADRATFFLPGASAGPREAAGLYHPPALASRLADCRVDPRDIAPEWLDRFLSPARPAAGGGAPGPDEGAIGEALAGGLTCYRAARLAMTRGDPDFTAVYFQATDTLAHLSLAAPYPTPTGAVALGEENREETLRRFYRLVDAWVGDLVSLASPRTLVVVVSDHGFYTGEDRPPTSPADFQGQAASWHRPLGLILLSAPWVRPARIEDASVLDIAPTVLRLLTGEMAAGMPGKVLDEACAALDLPPAVPTVPATEDRPAAPAGAPGAALPAGEGEEASRLVERLQALGYLEADEEEGSLGARAAIHLADYLLWAGLPERAGQELETALLRHPGNPALLRRAAHVRAQLGDPRGAIAAAEEALETARGAEAGDLPFLAGQYCRVGKPQGVAELLAAASRRGPLPPDAALAEALAAEAGGQPARAIDRYREALRRDPALGYAAERLAALLPPEDARARALGEELSRSASRWSGSSAAQLAAGQFFLRRGDAERAVPFLRRAVALDPDLREPRTLLGRALYLAGRAGEAFEALAAGLPWHPRDRVLLTLAGSAALRAGLAQEAAGLLERARRAGGEGPDLRSALALALLDSGRTAEGCRELGEAARLYPGHAGLAELITARAPACGP